MEEILQKEDVKFERKVLIQLIMKHFPDFRRVLNELQRYSASGTIDTGILSSLEEVNVGELVSFLKTKKFSDMRKWANSNMDTDTARIVRRLYESLS